MPENNFYFLLHWYTWGKREVAMGSFYFFFKYSSGLEKKNKTWYYSSTGNSCHEMGFVMLTDQFDRKG